MKSEDTSGNKSPLKSLSHFNGTAMSSDKTTIMSADKTSTMSTDKTTTMSTDNTAMSTDNTTMSTDKTSTMSTDKTTAMSTDKTNMIPMDKTNAMSMDKTTAMSTDKTTAMSSDKTTTISSDKTTTISSDKSSSISSVERTPMHSYETTLMSLSETTSNSTLNKMECVFGVLYNCVTRAGELVITDVLKVLYSQQYIKSCSGNMSVFDYCITNKHWSPERTQNKFEYSEYLTCNIRTQKTVDVNFAFKVIVEICGNAFDWLDPDCRSQIKLVKNYKYRICKNYGQNYPELRAELHKFWKIIRNIYAQVSQEFRTDFKESLNEVLRTLQLSEQSMVQSQGLSLDKEIFNKFSSDTEVRKLIMAQRELSDHHKKLQVANPFTWTDDQCYQSSKGEVVAKLVTNEIYTPLGIGGTETKVSMNQVLKATKRIAEEEVITPVLIINGVEGSGKTTICYNLVQNWLGRSGIIDDLDNFDLVFLIEHSKVKSRLFKNVMKEQMLPKTCRDFKIEKILQFMMGLEVVFIIDGYDETTRDTFPIVEEIFEHFSNKRIILTTRPDSLGATTALMFKNHVNFHTIEVSELDDLSQIRLAKAIYKHMCSDRKIERTLLNKFVDYHHRGAGRNILGHLRLPLTAALYMVHWRTGKIKVQTGTELHDALFNKSTEKLENRKGTTSVNDKDILYHVLPKLLGKSAWMLLKNKMYTLQESMVDEIRESVKGLNVDLIDVLLPYLTCNSNHYSQPTTRELSFMNRPQQAYYASRFLTECITEKKTTVRDIEQQVSNWKDFSFVLLFLIGHLTSHEKMDKMIVKQVLNIIYNAGFTAESYSYWWDLYVESKGDETVTDFIVERFLPKSHWVVNDKTVVPALKLLGSCPVNLKSLKIDIPNTIDPFDIPEFLSIMESFPTKLEGRYGKHKQIEVELHFWHHDETGSTEPSDKFLRTLHPWGMLVNFTGELGEQEEGKELICKANNSRTIRARLKTPGALRTLKVIAKQLSPLCRVVRITIAIPEGYNPATFSELDCPNLELNFKEISNENTEWIIKAIKSIGGRKGIWRACFNTCTLDIEAQANLLKSLSGIIIDKLSIRTIMDVDKDQKKKLQATASFTVNWM
nr:uncharacterized protein LOC123745819 [Procambarus clarkii]